MKFSIIVPVYNAEKYLPACIASVLRQTYADFELILVDDGSAPACAAACDSAAAGSEKVRALHQENAGQLFARLRGVEAAAGEYCLFLDADDLLAPDCLQTLDSAIGRYSAPDLLIFSYCTESPDGTRQEKPPLFTAEQTFSAENIEPLYRMVFSGTGLNNVWTKAAKRTVFAGAHPDYARFAALRCAEDRVMSMVMLHNAQTVVCLPDRLYLYRLAPGSVTRRFSLTDVQKYDTRAVYPFEIECLRQWGLYSDDALRRLHAAYIAQALYVFDRFYQHMADENEKNALIAYPWEQLSPAECSAAFTTNPYLNDVQKHLYAMLLEKDVNGLKSFFRRKKRTKLLRSIKRKLIP